LVKEPKKDISYALYSSRGKITVEGQIERLFGREDFINFLGQEESNYVSRKQKGGHFSIFLRRDQNNQTRYFIKDMESANGTLVNGRDIRGLGKVEIFPGDSISPGGIIPFEFRPSQRIAETKALTNKNNAIIPIVIFGILLVSIIFISPQFLNTHNQNVEISSTSTPYEKFSLVSSNYLGTVPSGPYEILYIVDQSLITVVIKNNDSVPHELTLTAKIEGFTEEGNKNKFLNPYESGTISLNPPIIIGEPQKITQDRMAYLSWKITDENGNIIKEMKENITILPNDNMVWDWQGQDWSKLIYAWNTPNDPAIQRWKGDAAEYIGSMPGYQSDIIRQLNALLHVLHYEYNYNINYTLPGPTTYRGTQKIRYPSEVLLSKQGMCIETTMMWASVIDSLEMNSVVIGVPGHAIVGIQTNHDEYFVFDTVDITANTQIRQFEGTKDECIKWCKNVYGGIDFWHEIKDLRNEVKQKKSW